jgi:hypothetical protein
MSCTVTDRIKEADIVEVSNKKGAPGLEFQVKNRWGLLNRQGQ